MFYLKMVYLGFKNGLRPLDEWKVFLDRLEKLLDVKLPLWYKIFMLIEFNETHIIKDYSDGYEYLGTPLKFNFVFDEYEINEDRKLEWLLSNCYVPISNDNGGGDYFFLDVKNSRIVQVYHDDYEVGIINDSISNFIWNLKPYESK